MCLCPKWQSELSHAVTMYQGIIPALGRTAGPFVQTLPEHMSDVPNKVPRETTCIHHCLHSSWKITILNCVGMCHTSGWKWSACQSLEKTECGVHNEKDMTEFTNGCFCFHILYAVDKCEKIRQKCNSLRLLAYYNRHRFKNILL